MVKYAPRKVYIRESGGYVELSYTEFCRCRESDQTYQVLVTVDGRTLKIVLLKMQGYSTKEIAPLVHLTTGAIYARLDHLRKKLRKIL